MKHPITPSKEVPSGTIGGRGVVAAVGRQGDPDDWPEDSIGVAWNIPPLVRAGPHKPGTDQGRTGLGPERPEVELMRPGLFPTGPCWSLHVGTDQARSGPELERAGGVLV